MYPSMAVSRGMAVRDVQVTSAAQVTASSTEKSTPTVAFFG